MGATLILAKNTGEGFKYARQIGLKQGSFRLVRDAHAIRGVRHAEVHLLPSFLERWDRHNILAALKWARTLEVFYVDPADVFRPERGDFEHLDPKDADSLAPDIIVTAVPDNVEVPQHHLDLVAQVIPEKSTGLSEEEKAEIESHLEPEVKAELEQIDHVADEPDLQHQIIDGANFDWGVPADEDFVADFFSQEPNEQAAAPEQVEDPAPASEPRKGRRRSRCKTCGTLHWKDESCPEDVADPIDVPAEPVRASNEVTQPSGGDIFDFITQQQA